MAKADQNVIYLVIRPPKQKEIDDNSLKSHSINSEEKTQGSDCGTQKVISLNVKLIAQPKSYTYEHAKRHI